MEKAAAVSYTHLDVYKRQAACSISREDTGATIGVHPNRKIGPVMDFGCKAADKVTVFRVGDVYKRQTIKAVKAMQR